METRDALEEQLQRARKRAEQCLSLEAAMIKLKREANDIALVNILLIIKFVICVSIDAAKDISSGFWIVASERLFFLPTPIGKGCELYVFVIIDYRCKVFKLHIEFLYF